MKITRTLKHNKFSISPLFQNYNNNKFFSSSNVSAVNPETITKKLLMKDYGYFEKLVNKDGLENTVNQIEKTTSNLNINSETDREIHLSKKDLYMNLSYQNRSIKEHEKFSASICEKRIYSVYNEHLKALEEKHNYECTIRINKDITSSLLYQTKGYNIALKNFFSPLLFFSVPSLLAYKYNLLLQVSFGTWAPSMVVGLGLLAGARRHAWLTGGANKWKGAYIVNCLRLKEDNLVLKASSFFSEKTFNLKLSDVTFEFRENDIRRERYFHIRNVTNQQSYVLILSDNSFFDLKTLQWLSNRKLNNNYEDSEFRNVLLTCHKRIEDYYEMSRNQRKEINQMAKIQIASSKWGNTALEALSGEELMTKLNTISDEEVQTYLSQVETQVGSAQGQSTGKIDSGENFNKFFEACGMTPLEVENITKTFKNDYFISTVKELKNVDEGALRKILHDV